MRELKKGLKIFGNVKKEQDGKGREGKFQGKGNFLMAWLVSEM